jgi:hypothetical protein
MSLAHSGHVGLMAGVHVAFVDHGETLGREGVIELFFNAGLKCRFHIPAITLFAKKVPTKPATFLFVNSCCGVAEAP